MCLLATNGVRKTSANLIASRHIVIRFSKVHGFSDQLFSKKSFCPLVSNVTQPARFCGFGFDPNKNLFNEFLEIGENDGDGILTRHFANEFKHPISATQISFPVSEIRQGEPWTPCVQNKKLANDWTSTFVHEVLPMIMNIRNDRIKAELLESVERFGLPSTNGPHYPVDNFNLGNLKDSIAIVGMSCRFPGANSTEEFWKLLIDGVDPIRVIPADRPNFKHFDSKAQAGFLNVAIDEFDAKFFNISPREAPFLDPQQRLLLEIIWESLEMANINPQTLNGSNTAVYVGIWQQDYAKLLPDEELLGNDFHHRYVGNAFSATAARISNFMGLFGPNLAIESGCSSSSSGVHLACDALNKGVTNLAIAAGVNLILNSSNPLGGDDKDAVVIAGDYRCKTFDERADGFVRAEGCGSLILKRYGDAVRDGDNIIGLIRGSSLNNDGPGTSIGTPNSKAQERVFREALENARVEPSQVSLVEAHGTGTMVGDPTEVDAIGQVYSEGRTEPLYISSVKTNIGHTEACAGIAGLIKVLLCFKHQMIPAVLHLQKVNPRINLSDIPAIIPTKPTKWITETENRIAAVSSFSMSGTNVHIVLQEPHKRYIFQHRNEFPLQLVTLSAKSEEALDVMRDNLVSYLQVRDNPTLSLNDIAFCTNTGRANLSHRLATIAVNTDQLVQKMKKRDYLFSRNATCRQKVVFLFTGQGSHYLGMGKSLYACAPTFREALNECNVLFHKFLDVSLLDILWTQAELLDTTKYCQPAIFSIEFALYRLWTSFGVQPDIVIGHSVGEFCASVCAGILNLEDGMKLVVQRSCLVDTLPKGSMLAINASQTEVESLIVKIRIESARHLDIAAINSPEEIVISGLPEDIIRFSELCAKEGVRTQQLSACHAFHSRQMDPVLDRFEQFASQIAVTAPKCIYVSGTLARVMEQTDFESFYWQRHLRDAVRFAEAVKVSWNLDGRIFIEIGAQPILLGLSMANIHDSTLCTFCPSLRKNEEDLNSIMNSLGKAFVAGLNLQWAQWFGPRPKKITLPTYPFQRQKFWYVGENLELEEPIIHPLLGRHFPTPSFPQFFVQVLKVKDDLDYIKDHRVGDCAIVPAAAFLEIILAAGNEVLQCGKIQIPFCISDMTVESPMLFEKNTKIQTVVDTDPSSDELSYKVSVHKCTEKKWRRSAIGTFTIPSMESRKQKISLEAVRERLSQKDSMAAAYTAISKTGFQFGPKFQSIKKAWVGSSELLTLVELPNNPEQYICHPIILDAMIQTFAFRNAFVKSTDNELVFNLPIGIKKFTWVPGQLTMSLFVYIKWTLSDQPAVISLYSSNGDILAIMEGLDLVKTSLTTFLSLLNSDGNKLPMLCEEKWRPTPGFTRSRIEPSLLSTEPGNWTSKCCQESSEDDSNNKSHDVLENCLIFGLIRAIQRSDWPWPFIGSCLRTEEWKSLCPPSLTNVSMELICQILEEDEYLREETQGTYRILRNLPSINECELQIANGFALVVSLDGEDYPDYLFVKRCIRLLTPVLQGKITPIAYMFPEDRHEFGTLRFYQESRICKWMNSVCISQVMDCVRSLIGKKDSVIRILEIGAGSALTSKSLTTELTQAGIPYQYTFTDISQTFLNEAQKHLPANVNYSLLDIEKDPLIQGFSPQQFDIILAVQVIHATQDINTSLDHIWTLLRDNGLVILGEQFRELRTIVLSFGFLDGWWRSKDFRYLSPIIDQPMWTNCLRYSGFADVTIQTVVFGSLGSIKARKGKIPSKSPEFAVNALAANVSENRPTWIVTGDERSHLMESLIQKFQSAKRNAVVVGKEDSFDIPANCEGVLMLWVRKYSDFVIRQNLALQLVNLLQKLISRFEMFRQKPKVVVVTRGVNYIDDNGPGDPNGAMAKAILKVFVNENPDFVIRVIDADQDEIAPDKEVDEIFHQLWLKGSEIFIAFREDKIFQKRLLKLENRKLPLALPAADRYRVTIPESKALLDIPIVISPKGHLRGNEVEVRVEAAALNLRDMFFVLQPQDFYVADYCSKEPGLDIAGIVNAIGPNTTKWKVGDEVFGFTPGRGLASHVVMPETCLMRKPLQMTFTFAATIPCAFLTVYHSLIECANLTARDRVLIHVATGGVGLAAIQVAKHLGAEIFATAGNRKKQAYLRSLGIQYVYHSRNTKYGDEILRDTQGRGLTVILNSLTGPNYKETTLRTCAIGARFIEIGKMNIWTSEEVMEMRPDIHYFVLELVELLHHVPELVQMYLATLETEFQNEIYTGLPHEIYPIDFVRDAFYHFQDAKHIGKVVLKFPRSQLSPSGHIAHEYSLFNTQSTYLITGGLGGLGIEVAKWMLSRGASCIILAGRSLPTDKVKSTIEELNANGHHVIVFQMDIGDYSACSRILTINQELKWPRLRGIMHAAGVLSDALLSQQVWSNFEAVFNPKIQGAWNLHQLTLGLDLEFFAMFSSAMAIMGMPGQSNHAAANSFLDSFTHYRLSLGLPALTMNFGSWAEVGVAANIKHFQDGTVGLKGFSSKQGIAAIESVFRERNSQTVIWDVVNWNFFNSFCHLGHYFDEIINSEESSDAYLDEFNSMTEDIKNSNSNKRQSKIEKFLERVIKQILRIPKSDSIGYDQSFTEIGIDSLMAMEMKNRLQSLLGDKALNMIAIQANNSIRRLSTHMTWIMSTNTLGQTFADYGS